MFKKARYVYELYREGSFTSAAQKLFISQPCLSAAIKQLENDLGAPLFERRIGSVVPTELGLSYIHTAERIISLEEDFARHLKEQRDILCGNLRIGGSNYVSSYILPPIVSAFTKRYPRVTVSMTEASSSELSKLLQGNQIDLVVDSFDSELTNITYHALVQEQILLAVPFDAVINQEMKRFAFSPADVYENRTPLPDPVSIKHFLKESFILLKQGNSMYEHAIEMFRLGGFTPRVSLFLDQLSTSFALTAQGSGLCFITDTVFRYHRFDDPVFLYRIQESSTRTLGLSHKSSSHISAVLKEFINTAKSVIS